MNNIIKHLEKLISHMVLPNHPMIKDFKIESRGERPTMFVDEIIMITFYIDVEITDSNYEEVAEIEELCNNLFKMIRPSSKIFLMCKFENYSGGGR